MDINEYKLNNGEIRYEYRIYLGVDSTGKEIRDKRGGFETEEEAIAAYLEVEKKRKKSTYNKLQEVLPLDAPLVASDDLVFEAVYREWFTTSYQEGKSKGTKDKVARVFQNHILPKLGSMPIRNITKDIAYDTNCAWALDLSDTKLPRTNASRLMDYAVTKGFIPYNPFNYLDIVAQKRKCNG